MILVAIYMLVLASYAHSTPIESNNNCAGCSPPKYSDHYMVKGCSPVVKPGCPDCIERYDCPTVNFSPDKCYYGGKHYEEGQKIQGLGPCQSCSCRKRNANHPASINCAIIDCPEDFGGPNLLIQYMNTTVDDPKKCYMTYNSDSCCGELRCPRSNPIESPPATCNVDEKVYQEGQKIYLSKCYVCPCTSDLKLDNVTMNPSCYKQSCYIDMTMLQQGCIPVYTSDGCCVVQYHCPNLPLDERQKRCQSPLEKQCSGKSELKFRFNLQANACQPFNYTFCPFDYGVFDDAQTCTTYCTKPNPPKETRQPGKCYYDGSNFEIGSDLQTPEQYKCTCLIPPDLTCVVKTREN